MRSALHFTREMWGSLLILTGSNRCLDAILGPRCRMGCGTRVFPNDVDDHEADQHAGDTLRGPR